MSYTIHRNVKVLRIKQEEVNRTLRTSDIKQDTYQRDSHMADVAELSGGAPDVTFYDFKKIVQSGHTLSVAVNDKFQVIAVINHTSGKQGVLEKKDIGKELLEGIIPILVVEGVCGGIAYKFLKSESQQNIGYGAAAVGVLIFILIYRGITKQYRESAEALEELKKN